MWSRKCGSVWSFSVPAGKWTFEAYAGAWFFTTNNDFYGGGTRSQRPVETFQAHVSYTFLPRLWLAVSGTYYTGGDTTVNGQVSKDLQKNSRFSVTASVPIARQQSLKLFWAKGASTRIGSNFTTYSLSYQFAWFDKH